MSRFRNEDDRGQPNTGPERGVRERLESLRDDVHGILGAQFGAAVEELQQLRDLLKDAAAKLAQGFTVVDQQSRRQEALAREIVTDARPDALQEISKIADAISEGAGVAVQGLQFEDMSNQLLQHLDRRLALLEGFSVDMSLLRAQVSDESAAARPGIEKLEEALERHKRELAAWDKKSVRQHNLDPGSVDLF